MQVEDIDALLAENEEQQAELIGNSKGHDAFGIAHISREGETHRLGYVEAMRFQALLHIRDFLNEAKAQRTEDVGIENEAEVN